MPCPNRFNFLPVRVALLCYLWLVGIDASAQIFPVQATTQLVPPYSVYLSDYATPGNEKLRVILLQRDLSQPAYQVRLAMSVELNGRVIMRTSRTLNPPPINLTPGIPAVISGADLFPYLHSRNLDFVGYSREQYERTKALPEGGYQITFTAYDYRRQDVQISNAGSSFYYFSKSEPPLINVPACGTKVPMRTPQQIVFSWLPRNTASPTSVADTQYELSLYEVRPQGRNPNDIVASTQPVFKATLDFPQYVYTPADPLLLENMQYAWRVRAIDRNGKDAFRNNGSSEICTFTYTSEGTVFDIGTVKNLKAEGQTPTRGRIWWALGEYDAYQVHYRKTGNATYEWFPARVTTKELKEAQKTQAEVKLFDLEPDTEYEARVQAQKSGYLGAYSEIVKFRTWPVQPSNCGDDEDDPSIPEADDDHPLLDGIRRMIIQLDDLEMQLMEVVHLGQGWYKGTGRTRVPFLGNGNFAVTFDRLYIDENRVAGDGRVVFVTRGTIAQVEQQMQHAAIKAREEKKQENRSKWTGTVFHNRIFEYSGIVIDTIAVSPAGVVEITDAQGQVTMNTEVAAILATTPEKAIIIEDRKGDQYVVRKDKSSGQTSVTKVDGGGLAPDSSTNFTAVQSDPVKDRIIVLILEQFEEEIAAWLRIHGKGGEEDPDVLLAEDMPACLPRNTNILEHIHETTIPYFKEHPAALRSKIESAADGKQVFDRISKLFNNSNAVAWSRIHVDDQERARHAVCPALAQADVNLVEAEYSRATGGDKKTPCWLQGWQRGKQLYGQYESGTAVYAGFIKFLVCQTEKDNCGSNNLSSFNCGITNGLLQQLDWIVLLEGNGIQKEDIANLILCVKDSYPPGGRVEDNPDLPKILFKCITGVELGDMGNAIKGFIVENWDEPYYHGQATAFVLTLITPFKAKLLEKLKKLPTYANKIAKLETLAKAKNADELVGIAKGLVKGTGSFANQIDNTLARLTGKAKYSLTNTGRYKDVAGHHPVAKKAFEGDVAYEYRKAFSVKTSALEDAWRSVNSGIPQNLHQKVTGQQNILYTAWKQANPKTKLTIDTMADIEIQAMKNVGIPEDIATGWVMKALEDLKVQGVTKIKNIPWNGAN